MGPDEGEMFEGFQRRRIAANGTEINLVMAGSGPPVLLLHGYPQTHVIWHRVAPSLARDYTVVAADLRGYGDSGKPEGGADHAAYAKRTMARDQVEAMAALGFERFALVGHDRGARVGHRLALDHPERVTRLALLDIVPTLDFYRLIDQRTATAYYHWFFLIQPEPLPERLIGADPKTFLDWQFARFGDSRFDPAARAEYDRCFDAQTIHASCEDYRAAASIDLAHDAADRDSRIACPLLLLWGKHGTVGRNFDVLDIWRERATSLEGRALDCGHYLPEEAPAETEAELRRFLGG
jgi:haloacetate dehalogenase